jgi:hypothetical protein
MAKWISGRINRQPEKEGARQEGLFYTIKVTPNELVALNVAIGRHLHIFKNYSQERETNRLLIQFQERLVQGLPEPGNIDRGTSR